MTCTFCSDPREPLVVSRLRASDVAARLSSSLAYGEAPRHEMRRPADDEPPKRGRLELVGPCLIGGLQVCQLVAQDRSQLHRIEQAFPGRSIHRTRRGDVDPRHTVVDVRARSLDHLGKERWQVADIDDVNRDRDDDVEE